MSSLLVDLINFDVHKKSMEVVVTNHAQTTPTHYALLSGWENPVILQVGFFV